MKSFTQRYASLLAYANGTPWQTLDPLARLYWIGQALGRMIALYDAKKQRHADA